MSRRLTAALPAVAAWGMAVLLWEHWPWRATYAIFAPNGEQATQHGRFSTRDVCERMLLQMSPSQPHYHCEHIRR